MTVGSLSKSKIYFFLPWKNKLKDTLNAFDVGEDFKVSEFEKALLELNLINKEQNCLKIKISLLKASIVAFVTM